MLKMISADQYQYVVFFHINVIGKALRFQFVYKLLDLIDMVAFMYLH